VNVLIIHYLDWQAAMRLANVRVADGPPGAKGDFNESGFYGHVTDRRGGADLRADWVAPSGTDSR